MNQDIVTYIPTFIYVVYLVIVAAFIILENRSPQSTFAWLFLFSIFPVIGLIIYLFLGRSWRAFAKEDGLARQEMGSEFMRNLGPILSRQQEYFDRLAAEKPASFRKRLLRLVDSNSSSILTGYNQVEILQNATVKYPRLLQNIKQAQHSIHLNYYIWTNDDFTQQVKVALIERRQAGVEVRCLYDASGGAMGKEYLQGLEDAGIDIHPYLEYRSLTKLHTANYRSHRKIAVIDGRIGYLFSPIGWK